MKQKNRSRYGAIAIASAIIVQSVGPLLIGIFIGKWLDTRLELDPLFMIIGLFLGLALGVYGISRLLKDKIQGD